MRMPQGIPWRYRDRGKEFNRPYGTDTNDAIMTKVRRPYGTDAPLRIDASRTCGVYAHSLRVERRVSRFARSSSPCEPTLGCVRQRGDAAHEGWAWPWLSSLRVHFKLGA